MVAFERATLGEEQRKSVFMPITSPRPNNPKKGKKIRNNTNGSGDDLFGVAASDGGLNDAPSVFSCYRDSDDGLPQ